MRIKIVIVRYSSALKYFSMFFDCERVVLKRKINENEATIIYFKVFV